MKQNKTSYLAAEIFLGIVVVLGLLMLLTGDIRRFLSILYSPYSFLLLVVILIEYFILKGMDRSRIYKLELERLKKKRERELETQRELEDQIGELSGNLDKKDLEQRLEKIKKTMRRI